MSTQNLEIRRSSASVLGSLSGMRSVPTVAKYIDTTTCIGCKACEVACQEWNDLPTIYAPASVPIRRCRHSTPSTGT
jgi:Fe-S-cluster-containing dehydrogenase component